MSWSVNIQDQFENSHLKNILWRNQILKLNSCILMHAQESFNEVNFEHVEVNFEHIEVNFEHIEVNFEHIEDNFEHIEINFEHIEVNFEHI